MRYEEEDGPATGRGLDWGSWLYGTEPDRPVGEVTEADEETEERVLLDLRKMVSMVSGRGLSGVQASRCEEMLGLGLSRSKLKTHL